MKTLLKMTLIFGLFGMSAWAKADDDQDNLEMNADTLDREVFNGDQKIKSGDTEVFILSPLLTIDRVAIETDSGLFMSPHISPDLV